ncbi:MAG: hypothetical protein ABSB87_01910 [Terriglobales bacterium]|jgi:hypothetical protein
MPASWYFFPIALMAVGGFVTVIALLPSSWVVKESSKSGSTVYAFTSVPIRILGALALFSYFLIVGLDFAPFGWHFSPSFVFYVCQACALTITVDPSLSVVLLLLAPLNAAVYGSFGAVVGFLLIVLRRLSLTLGS